jgi:histidine triad (HIT) family protein
MAEKPCVFCSIASGQAAAYRVAEDAISVAFLDSRPLFFGHVLVVPRAHRENLTNLTRDEITSLFTWAQRIARAQEVALEAQGCFVAMNDRISQSVPHVHVHVVPRRKGDGLRGFFWPRLKYPSDVEASAVAERLREALED